MVYEKVNAPEPAVGGKPHYLAVHPFANKVYVTETNSDSVLVIDTTTNTVVDTVPIGSGTDPTGVAVNPDTNRAYVANQGSNTVSVIDTEADTVLITVPVGIEPHAVAMLPGVQIDIKPGSFPNSINPRSRGKIPVAILTIGIFDATTVDSMTVRFGATGTEASPVQSAPEDVDGDGDIDLILHFNTQDTGIQCGDISATLTGETFGGQAIEGSDSIRTVGCERR